MIAWMPLAPVEQCLPCWGAGGTTIVTFNNFYAVPNRHHGRWFFANMQHGGATEIPKRKFLEGRFDQRVAMVPARMRSVNVVRGELPLVPSNANLRFSDRPVARALAARPDFEPRAFR